MVMFPKARAGRSVAMSVTVVAVALSAAGCSQSDAEANNAAAAPSAASAKLHSLLPPDLRSKASMDIAAVSDYPPVSFSQSGDNTKIVGLNIDLLDAVAALLGTRFVYKDTSYDSLIPSLKSGRFEVAEGGAGDSGDITQQTSIVDYMKAGGQLQVVQGNPAKITDLKAACGHKIGVLAGTTDYIDRLHKASGDCTSAGRPAIGVNIFKTQDEVVLALNSGRVDASYASSLGNAYRATQGQKFQTVGPVYDSYLVGIQIAKPATQLTTAFQKALQELMDDGTYARVMSKWGVDSQGRLDKVLVNVSAAK